MKTKPDFTHSATKDWMAFLWVTLYITEEDGQETCILLIGTIWKTTHPNQVYQKIIPYKQVRTIYRDDDGLTFVFPFQTVY